MRKFVISLAPIIAIIPLQATAGHSELSIPAAQTFLLGGDQSNAMMVAGRNTGQSAVAVLSRSPDGDVAIATVKPGDTFKHRFALGETALLRNESATQPARLSVDFSGSPASLSMRYSGKP